MFGLAHGDITPVVYGVVVFLGLLSMYYKIVNFKLFAFFIEAGTFALVFKLHGGSMAGGFAATIAALLAGLIFPPILARKLK
jgi:hypothetical protein